MASSHPLDDFLLQRMRDGNISTTALLVTFFCDVVTQHGGEIWLGDIIRLLSPLGINERLTRTSVFRLVQDGWLESRKQGRRSYYRLTQTGQNYYQRAAQRIYTCHHPDWDGDWSLIFTSLVPEKKRDALKRGLTWLGYGQMATGVFALPSNQAQTLGELLDDLDLKDCIVQMQARADDSGSLKTLVQSRWKLVELQDLYQGFISIYLDARKAMHHREPPDGYSLLMLRVLLIHEYRRILLKDPELPREMLPENWEGHIARALTAEIYRELVNQTANWVRHQTLDEVCHVQSPREPTKRFE